MNSDAITDTANALDVTALTVRVPGRLLVDALSMALPVGSWLAILGSNGSGKTRTLETLCRLHGATNNAVRISGSATDNMSSTQRARHMTLVTQHQNDAFDNRVMDNVLLGRYAHREPRKHAAISDVDRARQLLSDVDLGATHNALTRTLSGGERQRVAIAQALMQDTPLLLLDEPVSHQDPAHAQSLLRLFDAERNAGKTLVSSLHDVNIARRYATHALLLDGQGGWHFGTSDDVLTAERISALFKIRMRRIDTPEGAWLVPDLSA
ncbi:MAG: ABC transporter ATP-binding protein [Pseudomonadota bacterium]